MSALLAALVAGCADTETPEAQLSSAKQSLAKNDKNTAVIQLKNALQENPDLAEARFLLGKTLLDTGDVESAEKELRKALELQYPAEQVVPLLARSLILLGRYKDVTSDLAKVQIPDPQGQAELLTAVGQAYLALGNGAEARNAFGAALGAQSNYIPAHVGLARLAALDGKLADASKTIDAALAISPTDGEALQFKGDLLRQQKLTDRAIAAYRSAVDAKPDLLAAHSALVTLFMQQNKLDDATKQLDAMRQVAPNHPQTLYLQALLAYARRDLAAAQQAIQQHLRVAPENIRGLLLAGAIEGDMKSYGQAEAHLSKVLEKAPGAQLARRTLISMYLRSGQPGKALDTLKPVLDSIADDSTMLGLAGEVFMANGETNEASKYFTRAASRDPGDARKRTYLAVSHLVTGENSRGMGELEQAMTIDSSDRAALVLIAAHFQRRQYDKALAVIAMLEKKEPGTALPHNLRGLALLGKRDIPGARKSFERALEIDPTYVSAAANLARLDLADDKPAAARQRFESLLTKDPKNVRALLGLAALSAQAGNATTSDAKREQVEEIVALINKAILAEPRDPTPRLALIRYYETIRDPAKAAEAATEAVTALPNTPEILDAAASAYRSAGESLRALSTYRKLASLQITSPLPYLRMAEIQFASKDTDEAMDSLRKALEIKPDLLDAQRALITLHLDAGRIKEALNVAREVEKQRPRQSAGYIFEGDVYAASRKWQEAANAYRTGLKQDGSTDVATRLYSALAATNGVDATNFAATWMKAHPKDGAFLLNVAEAARARKDYALATQYYRKVLDIQPNQPAVLNNLAWTEGQLKDPRAIDHAQKANALAPNQPAIMDTLGVLLMDNGDAAHAVEMLQKASALAPQAPGIRLNLARALIRTGHKSEAKNQLEELAKLGEKFPAQGEVAQLKQGL